MSEKSTPTENPTRYPYQISNALALDLEKRFTYHPPKGDQPQRYEAIRKIAKDFATLIAECSPESRERSVALTHLENCVMWANASIARNE